MALFIYLCSSIQTLMQTIVQPELAKDLSSDRRQILPLRFFRSASTPNLPRITRRHKGEYLHPGSAFSRK